MDPLTALGVAANVAQFVVFAAQLISETKEIHSLAQGSSSRVLTLETTCRCLMLLMPKLEAGSKRDPILEHVKDLSSVKDHIFAINDLSRICQDNCSKLISISQTLKGNENGQSRWQSFRIAMKTVRKNNEIAELDYSLHNTQTSLTFHICVLAR